MTAALVTDARPRPTTRAGARHPRTRVVIENIALPQALRWRDGCLWFSDQLDDTVYRWRPGGPLEPVAHVTLANGLGFLPDGRLLIVSTAEERVYRREPDGTLAVHADLAGLVAGPLNDLLVDDAGRAWVGNYGFDYDAARERAASSLLYAPPGIPTTRLVRIDPDGRAAAVEPPVTFPNGSCLVDEGRTMLVSESLSFRIAALPVAADGTLGAPRVWASLIDDGLWRSLTAGGLRGAAVRAVSTVVDRPAFARHSASPIAPEALAAHPDGSVYVANAVRGELVRVAAGGDIVERIPTSGHTVGVVRGGVDGRTLYAATVRTLDPDASAAHHAGRIEIVHTAH